MVRVFSNSWALLLGMLLLMVGNGLQGTLLGIRGEIEGFSTSRLSFNDIKIFIGSSVYFLGFKCFSVMIKNSNPFFLQ